MTSVQGVLEFVGGDRVAHAPRTLRAVSDEVVAPRATSTLELRRRWERRYRARIRVSDAALIVLTLAVTLAIGAYAGADPLSTVRQSALLGVIWYLMLSGARTRDAALHRTSAVEYRGIAQATGFAFGAIAVADIIIGWRASRTLLLVALPIGLLSLLMSRWAWRHWLQSRRSQGLFSSQTLVVGDREDVEYVIRSLGTTGTTGLRVIGTALLDDDSPEVVVDDGAYPTIGAVSSVGAAARDLGADTIIVASRPHGDPDFVKRLSWQLEGTAAELVLSSRLADVAGPRLSFEPLDGLPLIRVQIPRYQGGRHALKRALDIVIAAIALVPIALVYPLIALAIKLDSPGPVLFLQDRVGRDGRLFKIVKFRSMSVDAEARLSALTGQNEGAGLLFKMKEDPRVTRVGAILRRLSIDELPQFWNVLVGDMSVVGPRPPLPSEVTAYDGTVLRRLYINPGITGLWQVSGRSDLSWDESVRLDLRYVENWSVMSDLQIMWRTAKVMIRPSGAY